MPIPIPKIQPMHMVSREKYIFHMLFGAFQKTPLARIFYKMEDIFEIQQ